MNKTRKKSAKKKRAALPSFTDAAQLPAILTAEDVAGYLRLSLSKIYAHVADQTIPFERLPHSRTIRFDKQAILNWKEGARDDQ